MQDKQRINLMEKPGVAVREMDTDTGPADYMLFVDGAACGIIEAKREGSELGHVDLQSQRYATSHKGRYIEAIHAGHAGDYEPMKLIFSEILDFSLQQASRNENNE